MSYHLRRKDKEITDQAELRRILKTSKYITISLCRDNQPYLVSLSHGYDEEKNCLYFHCAKVGKKNDYIRSNDAVWGQAIIDSGYVNGECDHMFSSVHFSGKIAFVDDQLEKQAAMKCMIQQLDQNPQAIVDKTRSDRLNTVAIGRINIESMTGKKHEPKKKQDKN